MVRKSSTAASIPQEVQDALVRLGGNIRRARLRRRCRLVDLAERIGVSRYVAADIERGKATTAIGSYFGALWALGLIDDAADIANPDRDTEGKALERARGPKRA